MLGIQSINSEIISMADAVRAEVLYDITMNVKFSDFYRLAFQKNILQEQNLNFNLYKYKV